MNKYLFGAAFVIGATGLAWVGVGFVGSSPLALAMTLVIAGFYVFGAMELRQFRQATTSLSSALSSMPDTLVDLGAWLSQLHPSLQNPVRLRIEGERGVLPGPALTPFLVGLLVMLGMLGTFLGMVVTLKGAVFALEKTTDLQAIRSALAVPVKGLGLAFGTSVAGVIGSAMLGLMSALSRRERLQAAQLLDTRIATVLRPFSLSWQREETFKALRQQSQALPVVVDRLQTMMGQIESMSQQLNQRLVSNQEAFHENVKEVYSGLARSVDASLRASLTQSAQAAGESIKPVVEAALGGMAREASQLQERTAATVQGQLDKLGARFAETATAAADTWSDAQRSQQQANQALVAEMRASLTALRETFEQDARKLVLELGQTSQRQHADRAALDLQQQQAWTESLEQVAASLTEQFRKSGEHTLSQQQAWTESLERVAGSLTEQLRKTGEHTLSQQQRLSENLTRTAQQIAQDAQVEAGKTLADTQRLMGAAEELVRSRIASEAQWMDQHRERMEQLGQSLRSELGGLRDAEAARGEAAVERLDQLQAALASHLTTLGTALEEPLTRLMQTASEAPRAAAEVIAQLRQEISQSTARDNQLLEERSRIMDTLNRLLEAINHATVEQRAVIDSLVANSVDALAKTSDSFSKNVAAESARLTAATANITTSAVDVSSLSEAFRFAVQSFQDANEKLVANLQQIEGAIDKSLSRSDEQLAYYVSQAREIIDLSMSSQKEIVEELRRVPTQNPCPEEAS